MCGVQSNLYTSTRARRNARFLSRAFTSARSFNLGRRCTEDGQRTSIPGLTSACTARSLNIGSHFYLAHGFGPHLTFCVLQKSNWTDWSHKQISGSRRLNSSFHSYIFYLHSKRNPSRPTLIARNIADIPSLREHQGGAYKKSQRKHRGVQAGIFRP